MVFFPGYRTYGVPTIRTDLRAPRIKRVCDTKNYGDESDAYGLVNPSIFSRRGVQEKDFLLPRTKEEVSCCLSCLRPFPTMLCIVIMFIIWRVYIKK